MFRGITNTSLKRTRIETHEMDNEELLVRFCNARHKYNELQRSTTEERSEVHETYRSVLALLVESMRRNGEYCVRCVHDDGTTSYVRLVQGRRRAMTLRSNDDVMALLENVGADVAHVAFEDLAPAVTRLVEARARARGEEVSPRISVVPRVGIRERVVEQASTCRELQTLTGQITRSNADRRRLREEFVPVRNELRDAERKLCDTVSASANAAETPPRELNEVVQMRGTPASLDTRAPTKAISVATVVRPKRHNVLGIRNVCRCVREAVGNVAFRDERFDERLREETLRILAREQESAAQEWTRKVIVRRHRLRPVAAG